MNQDTILQSNLLDIIFENRNKAYGAYTLRKAYTKRLMLALLGMIVIAVLFSLLVLFTKKSIVVFVQPIPNIFIPDKTVTEFHPRLNSENKNVAKILPAKKIPVIERPPEIVASININKLPATPQEIQQSLKGAIVSEINVQSNVDGSGDGVLNGNAGTLTLVKSTKPTTSDVLEEAEIMPQYPGGIKALLAFLKKNIHSPADVEEGEEVSVKIKFVVNYRGSVESFNIVQSGGDVFDKEVIRVLKKMPLWIPGKNNGENVSVYYIVPVKFTNEFYK